MRWDRPVVVVDGEILHVFDLDGESREWELRMNLFNVGDKPATVIDSGWVLDREPDFVSDADVTDGPIRIEPYDHVSFVDTKLLDFPWPRTFGEPFARVVRRPGLCRGDEIAGR